MCFCASEVSARGNAGVSAAMESGTKALCAGGGNVTFWGYHTLLAVTAYHTLLAVTAYHRLYGTVGIY